MAKYKIEVEKSGNWWHGILYRKTFLWWRVFETFFDELPYNDKLIDWQERFSIPDRKVFFLGIKP